jgi:hypothetical protein
MLLDRRLCSISSLNLCIIKRELFKISYQCAECFQNINSEVDLKDHGFSREVLNFIERFEGTIDKLYSM